MEVCVVGEDLGVNDPGFGALDCHDIGLTVSFRGWDLWLDRDRIALPLRKTRYLRHGFVMAIDSLAVGSRTGLKGMTEGFGAARRRFVSQDVRASGLPRPARAAVGSRLPFTLLELK